jgi:hypothetical protein
VVFPKFVVISSLSGSGKLGSIKVGRMKSKICTEVKQSGDKLNKSSQKRQKASIGRAPFVGIIEGH